jgi:hypothetical protein
MASKTFDTDTIKSGSFAEYLAVNLSPGKYPFFSMLTLQTSREK